MCDALNCLEALLRMYVSEIRLLQILEQMAHSTQMTWVMMEEEDQLMAVWPDVVCNLMDATKSLNIPDVTTWMAKVLEYNVPKGKKTRALTLVYAYKLLAPSDQLTEENIRAVRILAWCVEVMQAFFLVIDDIQDGSLLRRGQPCWYRNNNIGLIAINDGIMLENSIYYLIQKYFKGKDYYVNLLETFHDAGIKDPEMYKQAKTILLEMGHLFQVQDDYLDCFGDTEVSGKDNTDIQEGKCSWLVIVALQRATPEQRKILEECYGDSDPEKTKRVKQLFIDLDLPNIYSIYEEESYKLLNIHIQQVSDKLLHSLYQFLLKKIYHRKS